MRTAADALPPPHAARGRRAARAFAWSGMLLFFASLSFFLYSYAVRFGERGSASDTEAAWPIGVDLLLFTAFALHHSVFARARVRGWVAGLVPPDLERSWYVWIASILFILVCLLWQPVPGTAWHAQGAWIWAALAAQACGVWLTLHSAAIIDILDLSGVRQLSATTGRTEFKTCGPYGWVRHPIYTGWFLLVFGAPTMTMTRLVFAIVSSAYLLIAIPFEERSIRAASGGAYEAYAKQVRWKLIPGIY